MDVRRPSALLDALAHLLVRLHLAGFFWGDCSLSNTLFRRDAGGLSAYLVDAETGELHPSLSDGQRSHDIAVAKENVFGELLDVHAEGGASEIDAEAVAEEVERRYELLWCELTSDEVVEPGERHRIEERLRRLNDLGYDVEEIELVAGDDGYRLRLDPHVVEPGHHRRRLLVLTGLDVQENQARRLLNDIARYRSQCVQQDGQNLPESVVVYKWLSEIFEPTIAAIPRELWSKRAAAQVYHELLDHRWYLSEEEAREVPLAEAVESYVENVLRKVPDERTVIVDARPKQESA